MRARGTPLRRDVAVCLLLAAAVLAVFGQALTFDFVAYDDPTYVTQNPQVRAGLTREGLAWAFRATEASNWHPLTWLSHMLDCQLYGLDAGGHHATSVFLHLVSSLLLFLVFRKMTGAAGRSAVVAALFAVHPLHVESVAWVAERKDVLGGLFWMLTMGAYALYVERPTALRYAATLACFALGLLAKPMLVTLPFALLLLDYWPLGRLWKARKGEGVGTRGTPEGGGGGLDRRAVLRLAAEKIPFLALSAVSSVVTLLVQQSGGAVASLRELPLYVRAGNALIAYMLYMVKTAWPSGLSVFYPLSPSVSVWKATVGGLLVGAITALAIRFASRHPFLPVGWFWYMGTLVPVIGLIQVGEQSMADRYTYIPLIGPFVVVSWGGAELAGRMHLPRRVALLSAASALAGLAVCAGIQARHWRDSDSLFAHVLRTDPDNSMAHHVLGTLAASRGRFPEAIAHYNAALRVRPEASETHDNLGAAYAATGRADQALAEYTKALRLTPADAATHYNLANLLTGQGRDDEAIAHYEEALRLLPQMTQAHINLGKTLARRGLAEEAAAHYSQALRLEPASADAHYNLANLLLKQGRVDEAVAHYSETLKARSDFVEAHDNLGAALARAGRIDEAMGEYREALRLKPDWPKAHNNLASILAAKGEFEEAVFHYREAIRIDPAYTEAHVNLGNAYLRLGRLKEAVAQYTEALRLDPGSSDARKNLALATGGKRERPGSGRPDPFLEGAQP